MVKKYDMPFLSYNGQLDKIKNIYGLTVEDEEFAYECLRTFSYYNMINGYKECFMVDDKYPGNEDIRDIIALHVIEKQFLTTLFKYATYVEEFFKTKLSYSIAKNISVDEKEFLNGKFYKTKNNVREFSKLVSNIKKVLYTDDPPTNYYRNNHNHIPPWILFKNVRFVDVVNLYSFLKEPMKKEIVDDYKWMKDVEDKNKYETLKRLLTIVRLFRNKIAHNAKIYNFRLDNTNELIYKNIDKVFPTNILGYVDIKKYGIGTNDLYSMFLSTYLLLENSYFKMMFLDELYLIIIKFEESKHGKIYLEKCNFPNNLRKRIQYLRNNL